MKTAPYQRIAIVGVGLIGGSLGLALKRSGYPAQIVGVSRAETVTVAKDLGVIDEGYEYAALSRAVEGCDLIVLSTPIRRILDLLPQVGQAAAPGATVTDVGSTKRSICARAASTLGPGVHFIGGHPMAGSEKSGVAAADPFLFQNAIYIVVPSDSLEDRGYQRFLDLLDQVGAQPLELTARVHDQVVAAVSHLPQMLATGLVRMVGELHEREACFLPLAAGGFRDLTRIASSSFAPVWEDICSTNADQIRVMLKRFQAVLADMAEHLDGPELARDFTYAKGVRDTIPRDTKGFLRPLSELVVVAEDRPGVIAEIAGALGAERININDIEIMKVREGVGGTLRLGFDTESAARRALDCLTRIGYQARLP